MLAAVVLGPCPGHAVLDLAAAPGGKTIQMAGMMENRGTIAAVEAVRSRMYKLEANLRRCGVKIARTYLTDGRTVGRKVPARFDRVLVDAPCSSEARFRLEDPRSWAHWSPRKIRESARKQKGLVRAAVASLKPGGSLVYCTCCFAPEENEAVIHAALVHFGDAVQLEDIRLPLDNVQPGLTAWEGRDLHPDLRRTARILPDGTMGGFFLAKLKKLASTEEVVHAKQRKHRRRPKPFRRRRPGPPRSARTARGRRMNTQA